MSLSKSFFNILENRVVPHLASLRDMAPAAQVLRVTEIAEANFDTRTAEPADIAAFVLLFNVQSGAVVQDSPAHYALRTTLGLPEPVTAWPGAVPSTYPQLIADADLFSRIAEAAQYVDFPSAQDPNGLAVALRIAFGVGGLEDMIDARAAVPPALFIKALSRNLLPAYPHWFPEGDLAASLPADVDQRSRFEIEHVAQALKAEARAEAAKIARDAKRREALEATAKRRAELLAMVQGQSVWAELLKMLGAMPFDTLKVFLDREIALSGVLNYGVLEQDRDHITQLVYASLPREYFREAAEGDLRLREVGPKAKPTTRRDNAAQTAVAKLVAKYGIEGTKAAIAKALADEAALTEAAEAYVVEEEKA